MCFSLEHLHLFYCLSRETFCYLCLFLSYRFALLHSSSMKLWHPHRAGKNFDDSVKENEVMINACLLDSRIIDFPALVLFFSLLLLPNVPFSEKKLKGTYLDKKEISEDFNYFST